MLLAEKELRPTQNDLLSATYLSDADLVHPLQYAAVEARPYVDEILLYLIVKEFVLPMIVSDPRQF